MRQRVLYLSTRYPLPPGGGRERMILQSLAFLSERFDVHFLYFGKRDREGGAEALGVRECRRLPFPGPLRAVGNGMLYRRKSLQESLFYSPAVEGEILRTIDKVRPALVVADMIRCGQFVEKLTGIPRILEMDDLLSLRYRRFIDSTGSGDDLLGTFSDILPGGIRRVANTVLKKTVLRIESERMARRETEAARAFEATTVVSPAEAELLRSRTGADIHAVPLGIERIENGYSPPDTMRLLFIGNLLTNQNLASLRFIVGSVLPRLNALWPDYRLIVAGAFDARAVSLTRPNPRVELRGFVDDLGGEAAAAAALLSPIAFGTGIKIKILEAMSCGLPVITNAVGAEGIPLVNGENSILVEEPEAIAAAAVRLFSDPALAIRLSRNATQTLKLHFDRRSLADRYSDIIERITDIKAR